jgi:hypothetical protein
MSIVPGVDSFHPPWCARRHGERPVHERKVGVDLELGAGRQMGVGLQYVEGQDAPHLLLMTHNTRDTSLQKLSILEASILRDLLTEALSLVGLQ